MTQLSFSEIFVPGGFPVHTYNPRVELKLEERLQDSLKNLCKLVIVTGHTKSGKTVLVQKNFPREDAIWIDGGTIGSEDDFWNSIVDQLELFQTIETQKTDQITADVATNITAEGSILFAKGSTGLETTLGTSAESTSTNSRTVSSKNVALKGLRETKISLVIDDFHYLPKELQGALIRALKPLVFAGIPIVVIAIPHRRYDAVKVEKEMTGRILPIGIPLWGSTELFFIPEHGFELLKTKIDKKVFEKLTQESIGSPHLMQEFCRAICRKFNIDSTKNFIDISDADLQDIFVETAETIGRPIFEKLARGPRQRADRIPRILKDGSQVDIYGLVLHGLAHIKPGLVTLEYEDLRSAIRDICAEKMPQLHEVAAVLKHMSEIAATDQSSSPVIDFDNDEKRLHVTDPFFAFYLRWGSLS